MKKCREDVRILLIGDRNVGKTSLILSLVSEEFPIDVAARAEEITIPGDLTPEKVPTCIVDYSSIEQTDKHLEAELERADVVCVVYAVDDDDTLDSVTEHWLPLLRVTLGEDHKKPVILVGNKVDMIDYSTMEAVMPIMNDFEEIETCVECSARNLKNISEMFYFAQKAVLHPSAPLWNYQEKDLTDPCKKALSYIFKICDMDNDGVMSDTELARFQRKCFNMDLETGTLDSLKTVVQKNSSDGILNDGLSLQGFITLNSLFIQRGRHETTWTILRKFGFADNLTLDPEVLIPPVLPVPGSTAELTSAGTDFLLQMFSKFDKDKDQALSPQELVNLFSTCPSMPWGPQVYHQSITTERGWIGLPGYVALWHLTALTSPEKCCQLLAYLGYDYHSPSTPLTYPTFTKSLVSMSIDYFFSGMQHIHVLKDKKSDVAKRQTSKSVYSCLVVGPRDAGKTTFCQRFLGKKEDDVLSIPPSDLPSCTVNTVTVYGQQKHLVLIDTDVTCAQDSLSPQQTGSDVICLVYDSSNPRSFEYCARIYLRYFATTQLPVLVVGNKSDKGVVRQDYILQPEAFCAKHKLPPPQKMSTISSQSKEIFVKLATMAAFPRFQAAWMLFYRGRHLKQLGLGGEDSAYIKFTLGLAIIALGGVFAFRYFSAR
ncbi:mitochondrial Rho GTPase-like [Eurytemora carolleeae]|uniref:mitochondrial Rho GTPase-like n=1 Tax=Eurytemora carolleeae TaxID=1294199 RepID=UPI000C78ECAE|nr:mitochondrial Rho GTPase-like [Eurytemora carolleeae]|eukprot:XP_023323045.1 mitochondrial Rho GTPase-like [Eurytemora affinis]